MELWPLNYQVLVLLKEIKTLAWPLWKSILYNTLGIEQDINTWYEDIFVVSGVYEIESPVCLGKIEVQRSNFVNNR